MRKIFYFIPLLMLLAGLSACKPQAGPEGAWQNEKIEESLLFPVQEKWEGDFDGMKARRQIRVLVPNSRTFYFLDGPKEEGISYRSAMAFEEWLNKKYKTKNLKIHVQMIPTTWDKLLPSLNQGLGDIAIGGITITPERERKYDFSAPAASGVREIFISAKGSGKYKTLDDLAGLKISVREGSSYAQHIKNINKTYFKKKNLKPITIVPVEEVLEDEDILEMVNAGLVNATIIDHYIAQIWSAAFPNIVVHPDIAVNEGGELAWAFRKDSPLLKTEINAFLKTHKQGTLFGNSLIKKYVKNGKPLYNARTKGEINKFNEVVEIFRRYGKEYDFDYLMLVAQGYQESRLNQKARSQRGAVGIMQLLPSTANDPAVNIKDIDKSTQNNIQAGTKYLRHLSDVYVNDAGLSERDRLLMTFAAYNAGPGNLRKFRKHAQQSGLDPNVWFDNVEVSASRIVGQETVQYVSNIYKYYVAYRLMSEEKVIKEK
jgi:membrane-bound lytic murein transglycosylase MltF